MTTEPKPTTDPSGNGGRAILRLKPGRDRPVRQGHPWVFSGAVAEVEGQVAPGEQVTVVAAEGEPLAVADVNPVSQIRARILSRDPDTVIDAAFWRARLAAAGARREALSFGAATTAYRLVNAESDFLPGLIVDRYGPYLVMQCLTAGMAGRRRQLAELLAELHQPAGIYERSDVPVREREGLEGVAGPLWGEAPPETVTILENDHRFLVDVRAGHKTGFYLDQRVNRALLGQPRFVAGREVLNLFSYSGAFAVYAAAAGAGPIVNVDTSAPALTLAEANVGLNVPSRPDDEYLQGDVFQVLRHFRDVDRRFDVIVLDPPKFVHRRRDLDRASRGYKDLNWLALRLLRPGGHLMTFSCSGLVTPDLFQKIVFAASLDAHVDAQILAQLGPGPDHPVALSVPDAAYLKGLFLRVVA